MIRALRPEDMEAVLAIWLETNQQAHYFVPDSFWEKHYKPVQALLLQSSVYVLEEKGKIVGFIGLIESYIAGLFVWKDYQAQGIGKRLLDFAKKQHDKLTLHVFQKNTGALRFYLREGFSIVEESRDDDTGEMEYSMAWKKERK